MAAHLSVLDCTVHAEPFYSTAKAAAAASSRTQQQEKRQPTSWRILIPVAYETKVGTGLLHDVQANCDGSEKVAHDGGRKQIL